MEFRELAIGAFGARPGSGHSILDTGTMPSLYVCIYIYIGFSGLVNNYYLRLAFTITTVTNCHDCY